MLISTFRRRGAWLAVAALLAGGLAGCKSSGSNSTGSSDFGSTVKAKFAYFVSQDTAVGQGAKKFAELAAKYTGNTVQITPYPNSQLGTVASVLQAVSGGRIQMVATTNLSALVPDTDTILAPYIFSSVEQAQKALNSDPLRTGLWDKFKTKNTEVLGVWGQGFAQLLTKRPVKNPGDLRGMRIRIYDPNVGKPQYSALGANAVTMTPSQVFTALSTNAIDGIEDPVATLYGLKWYEEAKYLALTGHAYVSAPIVASEQFMKSLSDKQKTGLTKAFDEALSYEVDQAGQYDDKALTELKNGGVKVTEVDKAAFKKVLQPLYDQFKSKFPQVWAALAAAGADIPNA